jgi:hypothetical protein
MASFRNRGSKTRRAAAVILASAAAAGFAFAQGPLRPVAAGEGGAQAQPQAAAGAINVLRLRQDDHAFTLTVDPAAPQVGRRVSLRLDLATIPATPDPTFGDRVPVRDASLLAVFTAPGEGGAVHRQAIHPLGGAGSYGLHWTPERSGLWRIAIERRGETMPTARFQIGVGVDTPAQDDAALARGPGGPTRVLGGLDRGQRGGGVVGPLTPASAGPTAGSIMDAIAEPAGLLVDALGTGSDAALAKESLASLLEEARKLPGTVPERYNVGAADYDRLAADLVQRLEALAATVEAGDLAKARTDWRGTLDQTCTQCHVKFWWAITPDLSSWPRVTHQPWRR